MYMPALCFLFFFSNSAAARQLPAAGEYVNTIRDRMPTRRYLEWIASSGEGGGFRVPCRIVLMNYYTTLCRSRRRRRRRRTQHGIRVIEYVILFDARADMATKKIITHRTVRRTMTNGS